MNASGEPTPLSAEAESFRAQFDRWLGNESEIVDRFIALVREQDATIRAQATEIAALKRTAAFAEAVGLSAFEIFTGYKAEIAALRGALGKALPYIDEAMSDADAETQATHAEVLYDLGTETRRGAGREGGSG